MEPRPKLRFKRLSCPEMDTPRNILDCHSGHQPPQLSGHSDLNLWRLRMAVRIAAALEREKKTATGSLV
ncbi:Hypothetical protein GLP15_1866 [Giardia lamblia P15]|uniref:Uncharacterized protein n=1 Tax=Giardia intestinalis (strain P15) TaxID=658858 RepID=E1F2D7_GIAIA|nr:Hypothetical protein GLP15_1866 [Giardia lamblia P15]